MAGGKIGVVFALVMFHFLHPEGALSAGLKQTPASVCLWFRRRLAACLLAANTFL